MRAWPGRLAASSTAPSEGIAPERCRSFIAKSKQSETGPRQSKHWRHQAILLMQKRFGASGLTVKRVLATLPRRLRVIGPGECSNECCEGWRGAGPPPKAAP